MPGSPATLRVTGECEFPTDGYSVELRPANPQGINPTIYILDRIETPPSGPAPDVITVEKVHYQEHTEKKYLKVQINPEGDTVEVQEVV